MTLLDIMCTRLKTLYIRLFVMKTEYSTKQR